MDKRKYSLLHRLYRDQRCMPHKSYLDFLHAIQPDAMRALQLDYGMSIMDVHNAVWALRTPPSTLGMPYNGQGYYAAKGSRSCLLDFYGHNGNRLVRTGWLRPQDKRAIA